MGDRSPPQDLRRRRGGEKWPMWDKAFHKIPSKQAGAESAVGWKHTQSGTICNHKSGLVLIGGIGETFINRLFWPRIPDR